MNIKKFYEKDNKNPNKFKEISNKREKDSNHFKISLLFSNNNKNKINSQLNKTPDIKRNNNTNLTNHSFYNQENKTLNKILFPIKKDNNGNNKININNNNYGDNINKKYNQFIKSKNNELSQISYQKKNLNNTNNIINKNFPKDNIKKKSEGIHLSKNLLDSKKSNSIDKMVKKNDIQNGNDDLKRSVNIQNDINERNNENNKIIFNNIVKKSVIETKSSGNNFKAVFSDEEIENIFLLNDVNINKKNNLYDSINDLNLSYSYKKEDFNEKNKNNLLYIINDEENFIYKNKICSTQQDYDEIIEKNLNDKILLSQKILQLHERNWYNELKIISDELKEKRKKMELDNNYFNTYLQKMIKIYEHFNWLINSISIYYNIMFQNNKKLNPNFINEINLPGIDSPLWKRGFKWKGLYISVIQENNSKYIKNELKALNYFFFDYLQIIEKYGKDKESQISNDLIFPLIGYSIVNGMVVYVSVLINPDKSFNDSPDFVNKFIEEVIHHNKGYVGYYLKNSNLNTSSIKTESIFELVNKIEKKYDIADLLKSRLFTNMCEFHIIPIYNNKFLLVNLYNSIPNLFEIKFKYYKKIHLFTVINNKKYYDALLYNKKTKTFSNNSQVYKSPKTILEKYKINISQPLKIKDIIINKVYFRLLYENYENVKKNYTTRTFADKLFNYYINNEDENNNIKYIKENYIIIYDLIEPIKLQYSLIKNMNKDKVNNNKNYNHLFYLNTNYISYFLSWCKALNKNSYNIKTYSELKQTMKKFGIISHLKFFSLVNIDNDEITDIIKISLLVNLIKCIINKLDDNVTYNNKTKYLFEDERIGRIFFFIKCILYTNEIPSNMTNKLELFYEELVFFLNVAFIKLKLVDDYLSLGLLNIKNISEINVYCAKKNLVLKEEMDTIAKKISGFDSTKDFLKHIIFIARKKPFLFLSELELKLNFTINPFIKFKSSLSIESMSQKLKLDHLSLDNNFNVFSYVNSDEIAGLILSKLIYENEESKDNSILYYENEESTNIKTNIEIKSNIKNNYNHPLIIEETEDLLDAKSDNNFLEGRFSKKYSSRQKSSLPSSPIKKNLIYLEKESPLVNWDDIKDNFFIKLPSLCYKMKFSFEENKDYKNNDNLYTYLKDNYTISENKIFFKYFSNIEFIFNKTISCTGKVEQTLLHSLFYLFVIYFFLEKNDSKCKKINKKIKEIYSKGFYLLSLADLGIINLFQGLNDDNYIYSEEPFSKSVMLFLMLFGDPRGRNNDSHAILQLPLWKIARKSFKLERHKPFINQYFLEMYKSLEFFQKDKGILKIKNNKIYYNHEKNIKNNIRNIFNLNNIAYDEGETDPNILFNNFVNKDFFLSHKIFSDEMLNIYRIKNLEFLSVEEKSEDKIFKKIYSEEFIIYLFKQIQNILIGNYKIYDDNYCKMYISENVFNINEEHKKLPFYKKNSQRTYNQNQNQKNVKSEPEIKNINEPFFKKNNFLDFLSFGKLALNKFYNNDNNNNKLNKNDIKCENYNHNIISDKEKKQNLIYNKKKNIPLFSHYLYEELLQKLSYCKNCPSGVIFSFGNNSHNETAHDDYKSVKYPLLIYKLKNIRIKKIQCGWEHNIIISNEKEIYSFGHNINYQCGIQYNKNDSEKIKISNPTNISILNNGILGIAAACGNEHSLILDEQNDVYSFGNNEDGVLGVDDIKLKSSKFIKVDFGKYNKRIKSISAGTVHNFALTDDGKIFAWGSAQGGQLGLNEKYLTKNIYKNFYISTPTLVPIKENNNFNKDMRIIKVSCGEAHTLVLNNKKEVFSWGFGSNGQLGLGFCEDSFELGQGLSKSRVFTPRKIETFENKALIDDIECGKTFSMFISSKRELFSCGVNDLNQLGIQEPPPRNNNKDETCQCKDFTIPTLVECFSFMKVEKVSCGEAHCIAIIKDSSNNRIIWSWGNNRYGQLGLGDNVKLSPPTIVTFFFEYKENKFESISCGGFHSLCLIDNNEDLSWIEEDFKNKICKIINNVGII